MNPHVQLNQHPIKIVFLLCLLDLSFQMETFTDVFETLNFFFTVTSNKKCIHIAIQHSPTVTE